MTSPTTAYFPSDQSMCENLDPLSDRDKLMIKYLIEGKIMNEGMSLPFKNVWFLIEYITLIIFWKLNYNYKVLIHHGALCSSFCGLSRITESIEHFNSHCAHLLIYCNWACILWNSNWYLQFSHVYYILENLSRL